ncbi:MAG: transposase [Bacteroidetes bacterium]|nr:transposase [Bacteroidota bacterium]
MKNLYLNKYRRESLRRKNWDYGKICTYFITLCTHNKISFFGEKINGQIELTRVGEIARTIWFSIPDHHPHITLDDLVIMPDYIHGILRLNANIPHSTKESSKRFQNPGKGSLPTVVGLYKSSVSRESRKINPDFKWQSDYWEVIVKDYNHLKNIRDYIHKNPEK